MIPSNSGKDLNLRQFASILARNFSNFLISTILALVFFSTPLFSQETPSSRRFSIGPSLEESESIPNPKEPEEMFLFNQEEWNKMRRVIEGEVEPVSVSTSAVVSSTVTATPPKPPPGLLTVDLPYESQLSITGRKVIKLDIENTHISSERASELGTKQDSQSFNMQQELQARIQGTVARKTTINVNFDDTKENVKDFSVVYKGDPDEVVQEAAFGDILLSLPSTEFVNYNKQLFGIRAALKYKKAGFMFIGSRTKGTTETKRFTGATTRQQKFINDTSYVRRKFYDLTFATATAMQVPAILGNHPVLPINGTIPETVFIEDTTGLNPLATNYIVATPTAPVTTTFNIRMRQLSPGVDFSIDRIKGVITFVNPVSEDVRVAIDFTLSDGTRLSSLLGNHMVLIKDKTPEGAQVSQEIKTFYSVGDRNIVRDDGLGNFVLKVLDKNRENEIGDTLSPPQRYPDTIEMKFETGIFELKQRLPFDDLYASNVNTASPLQAVFSVEYQSVIRTFTLRPNIVLQSESVEVNGRKVSRDLDYFIDYDIGIITFFNEDLIRESTVIEVTYEFAPFGGVLGETLVGARGTYDIFLNKKGSLGGVDSWSAGSTVLYNFAAKPSSPPDVRSTPASLLVTEGDSQVKGLTFGRIPLKTNIAVEAARSDENPDLFGKAIVDSMEGIKQEDNSSLLKEAWLPAANPIVSGANTIMDFRGSESTVSHIYWGDLDVDTTDPSDGSTQQKALEINYSLNPSPSATMEQVSLVNIISTGGRDFSKKTTLEVEIEGAGSDGQDVEMQIEYGSFNEDADGDSLLDTEDQIPFDGVLNLGEDVGYSFDGPGPDLTKGDGSDIPVTIGGGNSRMDSEDFNNDRVLSTSDLPATFSLGPLFLLSSTRGETNSTGNLRTDLSFNGRELFQIPLNISKLSGEEQARLTSVKQVRLTIRNSNPAVAKAGKIRIVRLSVVGNSYEPATINGNAFSTMTVRAINSKDDATYQTLIGNPAYNDLYKNATPASDAKEQALALDYDLLAFTTATTRNAYSAPRDFSNHDQFRFFVSRPDVCAGCNTDGQFFFQVGSETEFQQASINIVDIPAKPVWKLVTIEQQDLNTDGTPDTWVSSDPTVVITRTTGIPNVTQVSQIKMGIKNNTGGQIKNQIWVNEIHVSGPHTRTGHAKRYSFDSQWPGWMDFGGGYRDVDRNWQTPTTAITNQDSTQTNAFVNFNRIAFLPMTFKTNRDITVTPSAFQANQNALVSFFDEGRVESINNVSTAKLLLPRLPIIDVSFTNNKNENTLTQRNEFNDILNIGATYAPKSRMDILPMDKLTFRPLPTSITYVHVARRTKLRFPDVSRLVEYNISTSPFSSTNLTQFSTEDEARLAFKPWDGFSFNPTYKLRTDTEERDFREDEIIALPSLVDLDQRTTPRSMSQTISATGNLKIFKWLDPRYNYSMVGTETNGLPTQSNTTGYTLKNITRNSQGEVSGAIQVNQILPKSKLLNSMNFNLSYKIENGDTYADMPEDFQWRNQLWVGRPLTVESSSGTGNVARRLDATDRRTFRSNLAWQPWSAFKIDNRRFKPLNTLSLTSNYLVSTEDSETTGTFRHVKSVTWPDLILTINDIEDFFKVKKAVDNSRLVVKSNKRLTETRDVSRSISSSWGTDYQFQFMKKLDFSATYNQTDAREDNLVINQLVSESKLVNYSLQTRIPTKNWAYTPRYERVENDANDSVRVTNDLVNDIFSLQIYGDISKPLGIRLGRREIGLANRAILNSTIKWDKKRSSINPASNYLDTYSATLSGDYTISQNFRLAVGGNFSQERYHPDFKKLDKSVYGINSTLTIQF
ncbi:MAG: hypothetical protein KCHDKBKB_00488 [Elusimicrobia bacterium]|nr:hypothetical protein [Elusimicrobiota bacterium]